MDKYIYDEKNGLWYELQGDYYLPCLKISKEESGHIGVSLTDGKTNWMMTTSLTSISLTKLSRQIAERRNPLYSSTQFIPVTVSKS